MDSYKANFYTENNNILRDYIEIKYSAEKEEQEQVLRQLLGQSPVGKFGVHLIDGLICHETLMIIKDFKCNQIRHLYILDRLSREKTFIPEICTANKIVN